MRLFIKVLLEIFVNVVSGLLIKIKLKKKKPDIGVPFDYAAHEEHMKHLHCICNYEEKHLGINRIHNPHCPVHKLRIAKIK